MSNWQDLIEHYGVRKQLTFVDAPLVSPGNDVLEMSAEIPYRWRVTTQIGVVLLIRWKFASAGQKHYPVLGRGKHHQYGISELLPLRSFRQVISGSDLKFRLFSLADWNTMAEHGVHGKELTFCRREKHYPCKAHRSYLPSKEMFRQDCRLNILQ